MSWCTHSCVGRANGGDSMVGELFGGGGLPGLGGRPGFGGGGPIRPHTPPNRQDTQASRDTTTTPPFLPFCTEFHGLCARPATNYGDQLTRMPVLLARFRLMAFVFRLMSSYNKPFHTGDQKLLITLESKNTFKSLKLE